MPTTVVFTKFQTAGGAARQSVIDELGKLSDYVKENEGGCIRYAVTIPRDQNEGKSVYVIEEYTSQEALDAHTGSKAVAETLAYFQEKPALFSGPMEVAVTESSSAFSRSKIAEASDPFIAYAEIGYQDGTIHGALEGWSAVTKETQERESDSLAYYIVKDKENDVTIRTFEVYISEAYCRGVHFKNKAVFENRAKYGDIRTYFRPVFLKLVAGWLGRSEDK
ncbi:uncharacterized protein EI97DRAFT_428239 [Westerdykella ornata]|uniref:ABM domain-containing protein n=1 Tax=Westerdykella ornata TaxID=318751 RepID=A0A6A6J4C5_WESOR|nr:uncharacterized protein EI97DRAFT_428239 [Westerdykella ornata]KAF2271420.1 hypothetical protein EI97DRAFT_428239 [Westerdykella ornata]